MTLTPTGLTPMDLTLQSGQAPPAAPTIPLSVPPRPRRRGRATRTAAASGVDRFVDCVFCHEGIPTSSFATVPSDPRLMSASCPNCALQVSGTQAAWEMWNRTPSDLPERTRAEALRARRVATATRLLRESLAVTRPREI